MGENPTNEKRDTYRESKKKYCKTLLFIHQSFDVVNFEKIVVASTEKAWDILERNYKGGPKFLKVKSQTLRREFKLLQMENNEIVAEYFKNIPSLFNQIKSNGEEVKDIKIMEKILWSLLLRFDHIVVAIEESKNLYKMTIEELQSSLEAYELQLAATTSDK